MTCDPNIADLRIRAADLATRVSTEVRAGCWITAGDLAETAHRILDLADRLDHVDLDPAEPPGLCLDLAQAADLEAILVDYCDTPIRTAHAGSADRLLTLTRKALDQ